MRDLIPKRIVRGNLLDNPAVRAWRQLHPSAPEPEQIEVLKEHNKSAIYRLRGGGANGSNMIAKRCLAATGLIEKQVYDEILGFLPLPTLHCHGLVKADDPEFLWLFIEDAGTEPFLPANPEHRELLARWLAVVHSVGRHAPAARRLPEREPAHFLEHLRLSREQIHRTRDNPALTSEDGKLLEGVVRQGCSLEDQWDRIEHLCQGMPRTFVHCDLKPKNMRIGRTGRGLALLCFDWETAGWGLTGPDLAKCPDLEGYRAAARTIWAELDGPQFKLMFNVGILFRLLAKIHWETAWLEYQWLERPRLNLPPCCQRVDEVMDFLGLN
jgi:Phosphotransferase enzyme family